MANAKKAADDKKRKDDAKLLNMNDIIEEEIRYSKINKMKLLSDWRVIMRIAKIDELRKAIELYMQNFERELDNKDAILQMLDKDIEEAEEHYSIALTNHFIHIKQLTELQDCRIKGLFKEFDKDVCELENEFNTEFGQIIENFYEEKNEIDNMKNFIKNEYQQKIEDRIKYFHNESSTVLGKIKEDYTKIQEKIKKAAQNEANKFTNEVNDIKAKSKEKSALDSENIKNLNKLERSIATLKKKVDKHNEELKQWKIKIKQNNEDWESKNDALKLEKEKIMDSYKVLKAKLIAFRNNQV